MLVLKIFKEGNVLRIMEISKIFTDYIEKERNYKIAYDIVRKNSKGKIWLIGGALSRNLNQLIHGTPQHSFDFDFIVEKGVDKFDLPEGWDVRENRFGNPKLVNGDMEIDYVPIKTVRYIIDNNLDPTIENVLEGTPFTIQSLAYDTETKKIIGDVGIRAFEEKVFEVNNMGRAKVLAKMKGVDLKDIILKKAESMGFKPVYNF